MALGFATGGVVSRAVAVFDADTRGYDRGVKELEAKQGRLNRVLGAGLNKAAIAGAAGIGLAVVGLKKSVDAARDAEAAQARAQKMLENVGVSWEKHGKQIDAVISKHSKLTGIDDEELLESFSNMVRTTKDVNEALRLNALAADISRTKGMSLASSQSLLARVYNGAFTGLKRLGIEIVPVTAAQDKLKASTEKYTEAQMRAAKEADKTATRQKAIATLMEQFSGQAEAYGKTAAGASDRFGVAVENLQEKIGEKLLPKITDLTTKAAAWIERASESETVQRIAGDVAKYLGDMLGFVAEAIGKVVRFFSDHTTTAKAFGLALGGIATAALAIKTISFVSRFTGITTVLGLLGKLRGSMVALGSAEAVSGVGGAAGALGKLPAGGRLAGVARGLGGIAGVALGPWGLLAAAGIAAVTYGILQLIGKPSKLDRELEDLTKQLEFLHENLRTIEDDELRLSGVQLGTERAALNVKEAEAELTRVRRAASKDKKITAAEERAIASAKLSVRESSQRLIEAEHEEKQTADELKKAREEQRVGTLNAQRSIEQITGAAREEITQQKELIRAMYGHVGGSEQLREENYRAQGVLDETVRKLRATAAGHGNTATQAGRAALATAEFIEDMHRVPTKSETKIILDGAANARTSLEELVRRAENLRNPVKIRVTVTQTGTLPIIGGGAGFVVSSGSGAAGGGVVPMVPGARRGRDSVLLWAMPGEVVLNPRQQGPIMDYLEGLFGRIPRYAAGGVVGPSSLDRSLWDEYDLARKTVASWRDLGTYNSASKLPSGAPSDHAVYPAMAFDAGFSPASGWSNPSARAFFNAMVGRAGVNYVILGDKIWSRSRGLHSYSPASAHANHVHVSGLRGAPALPMAGGGGAVGAEPVNQGGAAGMSAQEYAAINYPAGQPASGSSSAVSGLVTGGAAGPSQWQLDKARAIAKKASAQRTQAEKDWIRAFQLTFGPVSLYANWKPGDPLPAGAPSSSSGDPRYDYTPPSDSLGEGGMPPGGEFVDDFAGGFDSGLGDGGFDTGGSAGPSGPAGPTAEEIEAQIQERISREREAVWAARAAHFREFAPDVFTPSPEGLQLGSTSLRGPVTVIQQYNRPPVNPHVELEQAKFAADAVFG